MTLHLFPVEFTHTDYIDDIVDGKAHCTVALTGKVVKYESSVNFAKKILSWRQLVLSCGGIPLLWIRYMIDPNCNFENMDAIGCTAETTRVVRLTMVIKQLINKVV